MCAKQHSFGLSKISFRKRISIMCSEKSNPLQIVDISVINQETAVKILKAGTTQGFLFIEGHGITQEEVNSLFSLSEEFFKLCPSYKKRYQRINNEGYTSFGQQNLDPVAHKKGDPKEAIDIAYGSILSNNASKRIPDWFDSEPSRFKVLKNSSEKLYELSNTILRLLAIGLEIEGTPGTRGSEWFTSRNESNKSSGTSIRFLHYPGQKSLDSGTEVRAGAHTDYGSITLLLQQEKQEGLEIYSPMSKTWEVVPFVSNDSKKFPNSAPPLVVNFGDILSYWTAGILKSTLHRVRFPDEARKSGSSRYSIAFFVQPNDHVVLEKVPSGMVRSIKGRGANAIEIAPTAKEHLDRRLAVSYGQAH